MEKAHDFEFYFTDERKAPEILVSLNKIRELTHEIYPEVKERVSYAMPGFYPEDFTKATEQLFLLMDTKNHIGIYGVPSLPEEIREDFREKYGVENSKGALKIPHNATDKTLREILETVIAFNLARFRENHHA
jgi:uncharacterized protein YdhG (YjbR/CyaY superfamily)